MAVLTRSEQTRLGIARKRAESGSGWGRPAGTKDSRPRKPRGNGKIKLKRWLEAQALIPPEPSKKIGRPSLNIPRQRLIQALDQAETIEQAGLIAGCSSAHFFHVLEKTTIYTHLHLPETCPRCGSRAYYDGCPFSVFCFNCGTIIIRNGYVPRGYKISLPNRSMPERSAPYFIERGHRVAI